MELIQDMSLDANDKQKINVAVKAALEIFKGQAGEYDPEKNLFLRKDETGYVPVCQFGKTIEVENAVTGERRSIQVVVAVGVGAGAQFLLDALTAAAQANDILVTLMQTVKEAQDEALLKQAEKNRA